MYLIFAGNETSNKLNCVDVNIKTTKGMQVHLSVYKVGTVSIIFAIMLIVSACNGPDFKTSDEKVRFITNIDNKPLFSWKTRSIKTSFIQSGVQIIVADSKKNIDQNEGNIWETEKIETNQSQLKYRGNKLRNGTQYYAKIKLWDQNDNASNWSNAIRFVVPLDYPNDWKARWISYEYKPESSLPVFRKVLDIQNKEKIESARLYIAAPGFYEAYINGTKIGENVLDPGQTNYEDYTYYSAYDVKLNKQGVNVLGVMLGNGWYNQNVVWGNGMRYGDPVFIAQVVLKYKNGVTKIIGTDTSWEWKKGPISFSNIYAGESYDATLEVADWFDVKISDEHWNKAILPKKHPVKLLEQFAEPIQKIDSIQPKGIITKNDGRYIIDFGQNFAGWVKLKIKGEKGQQISLRCVEELDQNGEIDPRTTGIKATKVIQTLTYVCKGGGVEIWEPKFTYFGFRYAEVEGLKERPSNDLLTGIVVHSSLSKVGQFYCSEENINKLHQLADWTLKSNIHGIPTDCPHREKCGWTGDAHALAQALMYNYDAQRFFSKYMFDMRSSARKTNRELYFGESFHDRSIINKPKGIPTMIVPGKRTSGTASPDWGTAMAQLPWYLYLYYGDTMMLNNFYPDIKTWVDYVQTKSEDGIITHGLGDWCPPGGNGNIECPVPLSSSAYHILDLKIMTQSAEILGIEADMKYYQGLYKKAVLDFNRHFLDIDSFTYGCQTADVMALEIGIVPDKYKQKVAASLVKNKHEKHNGFINTGIFGISRIFKALSNNGFEDEVYRLLTKKGEYSFAYMWEHYDATTLWEVLPIFTQEEEMAFRSHSHPMQAGYDAWFYSGIGGINPTVEEPGFKKIVFKPYLTQQLEESNASYESMYGTIKSSWKNKDKRFYWEINIPENSKGEVFIPNYCEEVELTLNGNTLKIDNYSKEFTCIGELGSGSYFIEMKRP